MKNFKIGDKITRVPLIQGGMGVGISLGRLAGSVAKAGGVGIISTAQIGYREEDFDRNPAAANERAIAGEMKKARHNSGCLNKSALHGTTFVLTPVCFCCSGDSTKSLLLTFLHKNYYCKSDAIYYENDTQNDLNNLHFVTPPNQLSFIVT